MKFEKYLGKYVFDIDIRANKTVDDFATSESYGELFITLNRNNEVHHFGCGIPDHDPLPLSESMKEKLDEHWIRDTVRIAFFELLMKSNEPKE